jgi:probable phosphoglycerate mutase
MRVYLIRHAQTAWNVEGRAQGHTDIPLDEHGSAQAERVGAAFAGVPLGRVLSSDLSRCSDTAQKIAEATEAELELLSELRERSFGEWEGLPYEGVWSNMAALMGPEMPREGVQPPNGESIRAVWQRLDAVVHRLVHIEEPVAVVTHGGSSALLLAKLLKGSIESARSFRFGNTAITELHRRPEGFFLMVRYNDTSHLDGLEVRAGNLEGVAR